MARLNARGDADDAERQALLPTAEGHHSTTAKQLPIKDNKTSATTFLSKGIDTNRADILLIISFFISGMIDAGAYNAYECFSSMQTGNTVFAALGISDLPISTPKLAWTKSLTSILTFLLGSVILSTLHQKLGPTKRWVLSLSFFVQAAMIGIAALLVKAGASSGSPVGGGHEGHRVIAGLPKHPGFPWSDLFPIALLSFQSAGKVVASRVTGQTGLPVVVLTTLYNDLISDPGLLTAGLMGNVPRNRRLGGLVMYFAGATCGGVAAARPIGFSGGLAISALINLGLAIAWLVWFEEEKGDDE